MPFNLDLGLPIAYVDLGDGSARGPQLRVSADTSCLWDDFPVILAADPFTPVLRIDNPSPTSQISSWTSALTTGYQTPPESVWPLLRAYDYLNIYLSGYTLEGRMRFTVAGSGSFGISNPYSGLGYRYTHHNPVAYETIDTGWVNLGGPDCFQSASSPDTAIPFGLAWTNFSPFISVVITNGYFQARWTAVTRTPPAYRPRQQFGLLFSPPKSASPGLTVVLETDSCGNLTKTYAAVANLINAANIGLTATILRNGSDLAVPARGALEGAECTGAVHRKTARSA